MDPPLLRPLVWVGSSKKDFLRFPPDAGADFAEQLYLVQTGEFAPGEQPLAKGPFKGLGIREIRVDFDRDTYRVVYTVRFKSAVYVLHAFKKKSKFGISTPRHEMELVLKRYRRAVEFEAEIQARLERERTR